MSQSPATSTERVRVKLSQVHAPTETQQIATKTSPLSSPSLSSLSSSDTTTSTTSTTRNKRFSCVQSKVGSLDQIDYKPKPSQVKILTYKQDLSGVQPKVGSKERADYKPAPSQVKVMTYKSQDFSRVQSKVGSLDRIDYKPKASQVRIMTYKQDLSHVKPKVDARLTLPSPPPSAGLQEDEAIAEAPAPGVMSNGRAHAQRTPSTTSSSAGVSTQKVTRARQASVPIISTRATMVNPAPSAPGPRRSSASAAIPSSVTSPTAPSPRRLSRHILPTQKLNFDHVKSKVDSLSNVHYNRDRERPSSRASSESGSTGMISPRQARSPSPSSSSNNSRRSSYSGTSAPTSPIKKVPSFKIPDFSKVKSKVGSLDNVGHRPLGGNIRVFHEKLTFRENAQSKIVKEINIASFYQDTDDLLLEEEGEDMCEDRQDTEQEQQHEEDVHSLTGGNDHEGSVVHNGTPKALLTALEELTEELDGVELGNDTQPAADPPAIH
ncbi:hypothetical protein BGW41_001050 [Actinomortierella wolfii]|nr:hypothetical protein BGW41_001050 [Actinomortierella wolfii]